MAGSPGNKRLAKTHSLKTVLIIVPSATPVKGFTKEAFPDSVTPTPHQLMRDSFQPSPEPEEH